MMKKVLKVLVVGGATLLVGCIAGFSGKGEGDSCGGSQDDCGYNLTCQPVHHSDGSSGNYCCPTPTSASKESVCQGTSH